MTKILIAIGIAALLALPPAHAADPKVPIGQDPGGSAVAIVGAGVDYTRAGIAARLARDGEGEIIAWDFVDADNRPFDGDVSGFANRIATALSATAIRLIPIRVAPGDEAWLGRASAFAARTPAEIVVAEITGANAAAQVKLLADVARRLPKISFVLMASGTDAALITSAIAGLANAGVLSADFCTGSGTAHDALAKIGEALCATNTFKISD